MKENKNIERLFQEKFKDFEALPPIESWAVIEGRLNKKKNKKRVLPFWLKTSGIAALLALGTFLVFFNDAKINPIIEKNPISIIDENPNFQINEEDVNVRSNIENRSLNRDSQYVSKEKNSFETDEEINTKAKVYKSGSTVASTEINKDNVEKPEQNNNKEKLELINKLNSKNSTRIVDNNFQNPNKKKDNSENTISEFNTQSQELTVSNLSNTNNKITKIEKLDTKNQQNFTTKNNEIVVNNFEVKSKTENTFNSNEKLSDNLINILNNENDYLFVERNIQNSSNLKRDSENTITELNSKTQIVVNNNLSETKDELNNVDKNTQINLIENKNIVVNNLYTNGKIKDTLLSKNIIITSIKDSTLVAEVVTEENVLEQLLKEKMEGKNVDEKEKEKRNKWAVSTYASPVYFNSTKNGSPLDDQFAENSKSYNKTLSFGLGLTYEVSKRLSVKTGVNNVAFNYETNNVLYTTTLNTVNSNVNTISRNNNANNIILTDVSDVQNLGDVENFTQKTIGSVSQEMGYIEVPLELSFKLLNKKFGIDVVGGMSTLFLNNNSISLLSNGSETTIGEANNLNNIHFSSNVGLGFKYSFWKSFQANFQPMFKYQINTFSNDSGNFKPYFIGLYSGISFSF